MSGKHKGPPHEEHMDESWLIPYADLLTLLLALFVVLYASSNADDAKYESIAEAFYSQIMESGGLTNIPIFWDPPSGDPNDPDSQAVTEPEAFEALRAQLEMYLIQNNLESHVMTSIDDRGLVISMNDAVLFDPGSAIIKEQYRYVLVRIGETINRLNNFIRVEGHTDNVPMYSAQFPSNWELSGGRAASVVQIFIGESGISPEKLMFAGYAEFRPVADNSTIEGRGKNRRVDIIILSSRHNVLEEQHN